MQLSTDQLDQFKDAGVLKLEGLLSPSVTQTLLDDIQASASEHGMYRDGNWHCEPAAWPAAAPDWAKKATQDALPTVETEVVQSVVDQLMAGIPQHTNYQSAQLLFSGLVSEIATSSLRSSHQIFQCELVIKVSIVRYL